MTTYQLRDICTREMIIKGITDPLNRYELIETILRYRGEKEALLIRRVAQGGMDRLSNLLFRKKGTCLKDEGTIHNPARLILYNDLDLTLYDKYQVGIDRSKKDDISKVVVNHLVESNVFWLVKMEPSALFLIWSVMEWSPRSSIWREMEVSLSCQVTINFII